MALDGHRTLDRYRSTEGIPLGEILQPGRPVAEVLAAVLTEAARRYAVHRDAGGCLAIEGTRCNDPDARDAARALTTAAEETIRRFIATAHPKAAERLADYVVTVMTGMSAMAMARIAFSGLPPSQAW